MTDTPITAAAQLESTRKALKQARDKHQRVEHLATAGDYAVRAAARIQLEDVGADVARLEAELQQHEAAALREAQIARLVDLASEGRAALTTIEAVYAELDQVLLQLLERYSAAVLNQHHARMAFYSTLAEITPEARNARADHTAPLAVLAELEQAGADLRGVLLNFTSPANRPLDLPYAALGLFPGALATALREEAVRRAGEHVLRGDVFALPPVAA